MQVDTSKETKKFPSRLDKAVGGTLDKPLMYLFYGPEGVGKTTLAADAPSPIMLDIENGSAMLDVARYPFRDGKGGHVPYSLDELYDAIRDLSENDHAYKTVIVDSLSALQSLVLAHLFKKHKHNSLSEFGYGKGYELLGTEMRLVLSRLAQLGTDRGIETILVGHSILKTFLNPIGDDYDKYMLDANKHIAGTILKTCDIVAFCSFEDEADSLDKNDRAKGYTTGKRHINLEHAATWSAKARVPMPGRIEMDPQNPWKAFGDAINEGKGMTPKEIKAAIEVELKRVANPDTEEKVRVSMKGAGKDKAKLSLILNKLRTLPTQKKEEN